MRMFKLGMQPDGVMSEAIQAAQIAAEAAICAAWIQGALTVVTGALALLGGILAYRGAIKAAARQVRLEERKHQDRVAAYRVRLEAIAEDLERRSRIACELAAMTLGNFRQYGGAVPLPLPATMVTPVPDLSSAHWENHALLGSRVPRAIVRVGAAMDRYMLFQEDIAERKVQSGGTSKFMMLKPNENGGMTPSDTPAAEVNMEYAIEFQAAVHALKSAIDAGKGAD